MSIQSVRRGDLKTVGEIMGTHNLRFHIRQNGFAIAVELLSRHTSGAPVVDDKDKFIGFISEFDLLKAFDSGKDLRKLTAEEIMNKAPIAVHGSTTINKAVEIMEEQHLLILPVEKNGVVAYSVTRHDLLRARVGVGAGMELSYGAD